MTFNPFNPQTLLAILPEAGLLALAALVMALDLTWPESRKRGLGLVTAGGFALVAVLALAFSRPGPEPALIFGGMVRDDALAYFFRLLFIFAGLVVALLSVDSPGGGRGGG